MRRKKHRVRAHRDTCLHQPLIAIATQSHLLVGCGVVWCADRGQVCQGYVRREGVVLMLVLSKLLACA